MHGGCSRLLGEGGVCDRFSATVAGPNVEPAVGCGQQSLAEGADCSPSTTLDPAGRAAEGRIFLVKVESPPLIANAAATSAYDHQWVPSLDASTLAAAPGPPLG